MKVGVLVTSRNNYEFMEKFWLPHFVGKAPILNIDEDSLPQEKDRGQKMCQMSGVTYVDREERGMQNNLVTASSFFRSKGIEWLIWFQHDCWPMGQSFLTDFSNLVESGKLNDFGTVGFNVLATDLVQNYKPHRKLVKSGKQPIGVIARCPLEGKRKWYSGMAGGKIPALKNQKMFKKPFAVEVPAWLCIALNLRKFDEFIQPTSEYQFFHAWDDVAFQFLNKNIYNIALPNYYVYHRPDLKPECGLPARSVPVARKGNEKYHGKWGHLKVWKKRWGWDWEDYSTFSKVKSKYKGTLISEFYNYDADQGPLRVFEEIK